MSKYTLFNFPRSEVLLAEFEIPRDLWSKYFFNHPQRTKFVVYINGMGDPEMQRIPKLHGVGYLQRIPKLHGVGYHHTAYNIYDKWDNASTLIVDPEEMKLFKPTNGWENIE
jgi:hypothetical protein